MTNFEDSIIAFFGTNGLLGVLTTVAGAICACFLAWGGIMHMTSGGNVRRLESARSAMVAALIGFAIVVSANLILGLVQSALGVAPSAIVSPPRP